MSVESTGRVLRRRLRPLLLPALALGALACTGCGEGVQSIVDPRGPQAERISGLWWLFLAVCTVVQVAVTVAVGLALFRPNRRAIESVPADGEPRKVRVVAFFTVATAVILVLLLGASVWVSDAMSTLPGAEDDPVVVEIIGHQWWWEIRYVHATGGPSFTTANELRIPVGRPVVIRALSRDVIHSFWVPNLHGKIDMIPGRINTIWLQADEAGEFRGQCAEFCGLQHAKMALTVVAEPEGRFAEWVQVSQQPAPEPASPEAERGRQVFLQMQCSLCHTVRGTIAGGRVAPDLTRIGARRTLAAGTLPNTRGNLAAWIVDPQGIKPGNFMPPTSLEPGDLHALLAYLEGLR